MHKERNILHRLINWIYGMLIVIILFVCLFCGNLSYYCKKYLAYSNFTYIFAGVIFLAALFYLLHFIISRTKEEKLNRINIIILLSSIAFCFIQMFMAYHYYFKTGWDAGIVIDSAGKIIKGTIGPFENEYYSTYPNNVFLTCLFSVISKIVYFFSTDYYYFLIVFQCCIYAYTAYMVYRVTDMLLKNKSFAVLSWVVTILLVGISPWVVIPYSDSVGLFFPITVVYLIVRICRREHTLPFVLCLTLLSYLGYKIKPQIIILFIALVIVILINYKKIKNTPPHETFRIMLAAIAGILISFLIVRFSISGSGISIYNEKTLGLTHFFMMGLNEETNGVFSGDDVDYSSSFVTQDERAIRNLFEAKKRLIAFKLDGLVNHYTKKLLTVYNDGSFAWYSEGDFYREDSNGGILSLRNTLKAFYYPDGKYFSVFQNIVQSIWMSVLFLCFFAVFRKEQTVLKLSIIGLTAFELLFEARARYLLTYSPIFIILACIGFYQLRDMLVILYKRLTAKNSNK